MYCCYVVFWIVILLPALVLIKLSGPAIDELDLGFDLHLVLISLSFWIINTDPTIVWSYFDSTFINWYLLICSAIRLCKLLSCLVNETPIFSFGQRSFCLFIKIQVITHPIQYFAWQMYKSGTDLEVLTWMLRLVVLSSFAFLWDTSINLHLKSM